MNTIADQIPETWPEKMIPQEEKKPGYGTFMGVFVPSILMVFGVIIFLRMGWIVGQGLSTAFLIITLSTFIAFVTTLSMASISTNIEVGKGGVYYLLSRSLGIEIGSAIGIPLYLKQCLSIAFCVIGFAESLHDLIPAWSITSIGIGTLFSLTLLAYFSLNGALRVQLFIFAAIVASLISFFMGGKEMLPPGEPMLMPEPFQKIGFWTIFAIFFPAMTGIESSVSLSGDLRDPGRSLPLGTLSALLVAYVIYMAISVFLSQNVPFELLIGNPFIMQAIAKVPALIILGIWGATISSALGGLLGAPRTLQALAEDGVVPKFFGRNFGVSQEPRIATLTTCLIALCGVYFGSVNLIAPLLTMICLICYAVLNFSAGLETLMDNPSWRPRFRIHWSISLFGAALCLMAMMMIDPGYAILASFLVAFIYIIATRRKLRNSWDDIREGILLFISRFAIYRLALSESISKSWRPNFLVFARNNEGALLHFSQAITQGKGFITMASFVTTPLESDQKKKELENRLVKNLKEKHIQALVQVDYAKKVYVSMHRMIENHGLGPLTPNTIVCGSHNIDDLENLASVIFKAHQRQCNMVILNSENESLDSKIHAGDIHIWWHSSHKGNGEFMLVLAYMLTRNPQWRRAKICLKALVSNEMQRQKAFEEFEELSQAKRIPFDIEILVSHKPDEEYLNFVPNFSKNAGLIFLSLAPPSQETSSAEYVAYLKSITEFSQEFPTAALVLSSEFTPLQNILN
ncbi:putative bumetanide-sensitive Na-K-Cl [Chlamydiales bacterium STE3]|nr:putative bumetanide-sensitive Na-K-Cl [Chlamydiales bacterium STE3]